MADNCKFCASLKEMVDAFNHEIALGRRSKILCGAMITIDVDYGMAICTRPKGHPGNHVECHPDISMHRLNEWDDSGSIL